MQENHMGWKLVKGVREDVTNLFKSFYHTKSVRYEDFSKVWKQQKFSLIYSDRINFIELLEFTEEIFHIVKEYLLSVYEFPTRVAALYTLYGLYFKQPIRDAAKIRFTKSEWEDIQSLIDYCKKEKHYDVLFIHLKLFLCGAYYFTATPRTVGLERGFRKYFEKRNSIVHKNCDLELLYRPIVSEDLVNSLVQLESLYYKKKTELLGKNNIDFIDGKFAKNLQQELKNYAASTQKTSTVTEVETNVNNEDESNNEGVIRTKIKTRSYMLKNNEDKNSEQNEDTSQILQKKRVSSSSLEVLAKKKAQYYLKKLKEESSQGENSSLTKPSFDLPDLDEI